MIYRPQSNGYLVHREQKTNTANQQQQQKEAAETSPQVRIAQ